MGKHAAPGGVEALAQHQDLSLGGWGPCYPWLCPSSVTCESEPAWEGSALGRVGTQGCCALFPGNSSQAPCRTGFWGSLWNMVPAEVSINGYMN